MSQDILHVSPLTMRDQQHDIDIDSEMSSDNDSAEANDHLVQSTSTQQAEMQAGLMKLVRSFIYAQGYFTISLLLLKLFDKGKNWNFRWRMYDFIRIQQ